jgi:hypothetical protein
MKIIFSVVIYLANFSGCYFGRERGLNVEGPLKMVQPSSTGQTGPTWAIPSLANNSTIGLSYRFEIYVS